MGNHYTPKKYLRRFVCNEGGIWLHDRKLLLSRLTTVQAVGNEVGLYSPTVESNLNIQVEGPTHPIFDKIARREHLTRGERQALAKYIVVMYKRVPIARDRSMKRVPKMANALHDSFMMEITQLGSTDPTFQAEEAIRNVTAAIEKVRQSPSPKLWYEGINLIDEGPAERSLLSMNWVFLHSEKLQFLTSDNPVFFFEHEGIDSPTSELTFPISSSVALWATRKSEQDGLHAIAIPAVIKQINRRTAHGCNRFIFSRENEPWIMPFIKKGEWELVRMGR